VKQLMLVLISALALCACQPKATAPRRATPEVSSAAEKLRIEEAKVVQLVKDNLKDQDSARFRNVRRLPFMGIESGPEVYCGEVNAKNSFGGYSGFGDFVANLGDGKAYIVESDNKAAQLEYMVLCLDNGKPRPGKAVTLG
jgi:uncharacterized protein YdiU (UPF0061 family)